MFKKSKQCINCPNYDERTECKCNLPNFLRKWDKKGNVTTKKRAN